MFVINKVIDKNMIKNRITEKHEMNFKKLEEMLVQEIDLLDLLGVQIENDINIFQFYLREYYSYNFRIYSKSTIYQF